MSPILLVLAIQGATIGAGDDCYQGATTQMAIDKCAAQDLEAANSKLATFTKSYETRLTPEKLSLFRSAQVSWEQFRQSNCKFEASSVVRGSVYPEVLDRCLAERARSRLSELESLSNCKDGDYVCPTDGT